MRLDAAAVVTSEWVASEHTKTRRERLDCLVATAALKIVAAGEGLSAWLNDRCVDVCVHKHATVVNRLERPVGELVIQPRNPVSRLVSGDLAGGAIRSD